MQSTLYRGDSSDDDFFEQFSTSSHVTIIGLGGRERKSQKAAGAMRCSEREGKERPGSNQMHCLASSLAAALALGRPLSSCAVLLAAWGLA